MVVVDSTVWVHFLRTPTTFLGQEMKRLLETGEVGIVGVVLAEVLQGARSEKEFGDLALRLNTQTYLEESKETWVTVGGISMQLRARGQMIPLTDLVIGAIALEHGCQVYTLDEHFQRIPGLVLHETGQ